MNRGKGGCEVDMVMKVYGENIYIDYFKRIVSGIGLVQDAKNVWHLWLWLASENVKKVGWLLGVVVISENSCVDKDKGLIWENVKVQGML